jgi:hypothetical protein
VAGAHEQAAALASRAAAARAHDQAPAPTSRAAARVAVDDPAVVATLLDALRTVGLHYQGRKLPLRATSQAASMTRPP